VKRIPRNVDKAVLAALQPGDVILSFGREPLSYIIREIGGGDYSHATIWDGDHLVETMLRGVSLLSLTHETRQQEYVDVFRWRTKDPPVLKLGDPAYPRQPVAATAAAIGRSNLTFAKGEAVLLALVALFSSVPPSGLLRALVRIITGEIDRWFHVPGQRKMICTEVVCTSFWEADAASRRYAIHIPIDASRSTELVRIASAPPAHHLGPVNPDLAAYEAIRKDLANRLLVAAGPTQQAALRQAALVAPPKHLTGPIFAEVGGDFVPLFAVTPHDLQLSPNLEPVGRLSTLPKLPMPRTWLGRLVSGLGLAPGAPARPPRARRGSFLPRVKH
jgi:hypothetical protein